MTKVQNPIIGRSRGSAGGMTFSKSLGKNIMRAKAFEVANPKTAAQTTQRTFFAQVSDMIQNFNPEQLRALFPKMPKGITRRNALFRQVSQENETVDSVKKVKTTDILSLGNAPMMQMGTTTATISNGVVSVKLDATLKANTDVKDLFFVVVVVNDTKAQMVFPDTNEKVATGTLDVSVPATWEDTDTVHAIPLITNSLAAFSGFGALSVTVRPERKQRTTP